MAEYPTKDQLAKLQNLINEKDFIEQHIVALDDQIHEYRSTLKQIVETDIPLLLAEYNIRDITMLDGRKLTVKEIITCSIPKDKRHAAFRWLEANGFGSLVKNQFIVAFGKGESTRANSFRTMLQNLGLPSESQESIHPQTLKAFVKEQLEAGRPLPDELINWYVVQQAVIT